MTSGKPFIYATILLLGGIVVFLFSLSLTHNTTKVQVLKSITPELVQQMQQQNKMLVIVLGAQGCGACDKALEIIKADQELSDYFTHQAYFCYITPEQKNQGQMLLNSLFQTSHPTTYLFQSNLKLYSYIASMKDYKNTLKKCIQSPMCINLPDYSQYKNRYSTHSLLEQLKPENLKGMLENSFAGCIYLENDPQKACAYLQKSLQYGIFFYNTYLMYKCQYLLQDSLQIQTYKNLSLQNQSSLEWYLYEKELKELGANIPEEHKK